MLFVILFYYFIFAENGTASKKLQKDFYISGYNESRIEFTNDTALRYVYETSELLQLSCHLKVKRGQVFWLQWLHNDRKINNTKTLTNDNNLSFNISEDNDGDALTCLASEDTTGLSEDEKKVEERIVLKLHYLGRTSSVSPVVGSISNAVTRADDKNITHDVMDYIVQNNMLLICVCLGVFVVILGSTILIMVCKRSSKKREDKVNLNASSSNCSVITTIPINVPRGVTDSSYANSLSYANVEVPSAKIYDYQEPFDSQGYSEPQTYADPNNSLYTIPIPKRFRNVHECYSNSKDIYTDYTNVNNDGYENVENTCDTYYSSTYF